MMGTCTIIAQGTIGANCADEIIVCLPLKEALERADEFKLSGRFTFVRVYAETNNGATLTLIYQPTN